MTDLPSCPRCDAPLTEANTCSRKQEFCDQLFEQREAWLSTYWRVGIFSDAESWELCDRMDRWAKKHGMPVVFNRDKQGVLPWDFGPDRSGGFRDVFVEGNRVDRILSGDTPELEEVFREGPLGALRLFKEVLYLRELAEAAEAFTNGCTWPVSSELHTAIEVWRERCAKKIPDPCPKHRDGYAAKCVACHQHWGSIREEARQLGEQLRDAKKAVEAMPEWFQTMARRSNEATEYCREKGAVKVDSEAWDRAMGKPEGKK